jgi:hypothetical protein
MSQQFALISREALRSIPGAVRKDGEVSDRWFTRAAKVWREVAGRPATLQLGRKGTSADGGLWLVASPRDYFGAGAPDRMRVDFLEALGAGSGGGLRT